MNIYELSQQYNELLLMSQSEDVDPEVFADTLEALDGEIEDKAEGYAKVIAQLKADSDALAMESARLDARRTAIDNNIKRMKKALQEAMIATGKTKFKTTLFSFGIQKNPARLVFDAENVPDEYMIPQPSKPDNQKIKDLLKNGTKLSFAHLEQSEGLRIR